MDRDATVQDIDIYMPVITPQHRHESRYNMAQTWSEYDPDMEINKTLDNHTATWKKTQHCIDIDDYLSVLVAKALKMTTSKCKPGSGTIFSQQSRYL